MLDFLQRLPGTLAGLPARLIAWLRGLGWRNTVVLAAGIIGLIVVISVIGNGNGEAPLSETERTVSVLTVAELSSERAALPVFGVVRSQSEAQVRSESSGEVVNIYRSLGDRVSAGAVIAEMKNSSERAALLQAQATYDVASVALSKVQGSVRDEQLSILQTNLQSAKNALASSYTSATNVLLSAYDAVDDSVRRKADQMFTDANTSSPKLNIIVTDSQLVIDLGRSRARMSEILERQRGVAPGLSNANIEQELARAQQEMLEVRTFADMLVSALNKAVADQSTSESDIASYKTDAATARTNVNASLSALAAAKEALDARKSAVEVAEKNLELGVVGGQAEDIASAQAGVRQAEAGLASARAALERTVIRAPIPGTINFLSIKRGDFVSSFTHVATIANNQALEIIAYVSEADVRTFSVGSKVGIENRFSGVVTKIVPAADPTTKRIEIRIGVAEGSSLINGQAVTLAIVRESGAAAAAEDRSAYTIPIAALKIETNRTIVFTVGEGGTLVAHSVVLGNLLGDKVEITEGLTPDMAIVLDARGLKEGQEVTVR